VNAARVARERGRLFIGTSGYQYRHWRGLLYPPQLAIARSGERS